MSEESEARPEAAVEPWPVWSASPPEGAKETGAFTRSPADALRASLIFTGMAVVTGIGALVLGYHTVPLLLLLVHLPGWLRGLGKARAEIREVRREAYRDVEFQAARLEDEARERETRLSLYQKVEAARPELANGYDAVSPLVLIESGIATYTLLGDPDKATHGAWTHYARFEVVERQENALIVRLVEKPEASRAYWKDTLAFVSAGWWDAAGMSFWKRLEASAPMLGALWIFLVSLVKHGWRVDTLAAFCVWQAHLFLYSSLARLWRDVQAHDFDRHPNHAYLAFDLRAASEAEALARLRRHLGE
jgi:hypothetical protein